MRMVYKMMLIMVTIVAIVIIFVRYKFLTPNSQLSKMTVEEIKAYFYDHKKQFDKLVTICDQYPEITFIDTTKIDKLQKYYSYELSDGAIKKIKEAQNIIKDLKIYNMQCGSGVGNNPNELAGVSFMLYSQGLFKGGGSQSIEYETKVFRDLFKDKKRIKIEDEKIYPLDFAGWRIVFSK